MPPLGLAHHGSWPAGPGSCYQWGEVCRLRAALAGGTLLVVFAVGVAACGGGAATTTVGARAPAGIVVDRSIGPVSIGLAERRVIGLLGRPKTSFPVYSGSRKPGTLAHYESHGGELLIIYDATGHVASIETYSPYYRTVTGVGPGASLARAARLPGFRQDFCELGYWNATGRTDPHAVVTVFTPNAGRVASVLIAELRFDTYCDEASQGSQPRPSIVVDHTINGVSLGMSKTAVAGVLGQPASRRAVTLGPGAAGTLARYTVDGAPFLVTYNAGGRAVALQAFSNVFFTPAGIGPGSPRAFVAVLRGFARDPCGLGFWDGAARASPTRPVTVFTVSRGRVTSVLISGRALFTRCTTR